MTAFHSQPHHTTSMQTRITRFLVQLILFVTILATMLFKQAVSAPAEDGKRTVQPLSGQLAENESTLEVDTPTLERMEKIADSYRRRGLYSYAEAIIEDVFEIRQKLKGPDDPRWLTTTTTWAFSRPSRENTPTRSLTI